MVIVRDEGLLAQLHCGNKIFNLYSPLSFTRPIREILLEFTASTSSIFCSIYQIKLKGK